jgi:TrmH family RNA methyltransferase
MITSLSNDHVKDVRALQTRKRHREKTGRFVVEGTRLVEEAALSGVPIESVFYTEDYAAGAAGAALLDELSLLGAVLIPVDGPVMEAMSDTQTPQGVLAVLPTPALDVPEDLPFALVIDGVGDPGNLGTIMRAAASGAVPLLIIAPGTVDPFNPKVVRGAMGAHFRLPVRQLSWGGIAGALAGRAIFLADIGTGANYYDVDWTQPCALIVSEEAHGPSEDAARLAHARVTIPMPGHMESLNVAMAASILIFERVRQQATHERS